MNVMQMRMCLVVALLAVAMMAPTSFGAEKAVGDPYSLNTCAVSGEPIEEMSEAVVEVIDGREVRLCCNNCAKKIKADPAEGLKKVDAKMIKHQLAVYPLDTCLVSGEKVAKEDAVHTIVANRLVQTCCDNCAKKIKAAPAEYIEKLDAAVIEAEKDAYPLKTCPVSGEKLGGMGDPVPLVVANRLVSLCCAGCKSKVTADPAKFIAMVDKAAGRGTAGLKK